MVQPSQNKCLQWSSMECPNMTSTSRRTNKRTSAAASSMQIAAELRSTESAPCYNGPVTQMRQLNPFALIQKVLTKLMMPWNMELSLDPEHTVPGGTPQSARLHAATTAMNIITKQSHAKTKPNVADAHKTNE